MTTRKDVVEEAKSWLGTPYHHLAKIKGAGVDCGQLLIGVYSNVGLIPDIETGYYPNDWHFHRSEEQYIGWVSKYAKPTDNPKVGDVMLFKFGRCISHGGILVGDNLIIHSYLRQGCVYARLDDAELNGRLAMCFTLWDDE